MARNPKHAQDKVRRGSSGSNIPASQPTAGTEEKKKEMQDPLTRQDPNCEGEYFDEDVEEEREEVGTGQGKTGGGA